MPSRDPDDGEIDNVDEFLDSLGDVEYDEALIHVLGMGLPLRNLPNQEDQRLVDALGIWRDEIDAEPYATDVSSVINGEHTPGHQLATIAGGNVSDIARRAQELIVLANNAPEGEVRAVMASIQIWGNQAHALLGNTSGGMMLQSMVQQALQTCQELLQGIAIVRETAVDEGNKHLG